MLDHGVDDHGAARPRAEATARPLANLHLALSIGHADASRSRHWRSARAHPRRHVSAVGRRADAHRLRALEPSPSSRPTGARRHLRALRAGRRRRASSSSAKRYDLSLTAERPPRRCTLGIGAVFTPKKQRGRGHAPAIVKALEDAGARRRRRGGAAVLGDRPRLLRAARVHDRPRSDRRHRRRARQGRAGDARAERRGSRRRHVAAMHVSARHGLHGRRCCPTRRRSSTRSPRSGMFVGLHPSRRRRIEYFVAEEGHQAVALPADAGLAPSRPAAGDLECRGVRRPRPVRRAHRRDAAGAARAQPRPRAPSIIRGWWPRPLRPPQLTFTVRRQHAGEVMMLKPSASRVTLGALTVPDVMYFHGDAF